MILMQHGNAGATRSARLALAITLTGLIGAPAAAGPATRIFTGGAILTMNDAAMRAEALAEENGRIVAVGSTADVMKLQGPATEVIDLKGQAMVPGFVDPHGHIVMGGLQALSANLLSPPDGEVTDIPGLLQTLRDWVAANADKVKQAGVIIGFGYEPANMKEHRHPTRDELDQVSKDLPVIIIHQSAHLAAANSKALAMAGLTAASQDPPGGVIRRREGSQEPNGVLEESAMYPIAAKIFPQLGQNGFKAFARAGAALWASFGYTTAQEGRATPDMVAVLQQVAAEGGFSNDITVYPDVMIGRDKMLPLVGKPYVNRLRVAGFKISLDGSPQGFTAWRDKPYYKPVGNYPIGYAGYSALTDEQAREAIAWTYANKVQLLSHANGERASDLYITSLTAAEAKYGAADRRPVLIHGQFLREDQVDSYKALGVIPSLFPMHTFYWGDWHRDQTVGPVAAENISPTGWVRQRGMIFTSHHDAPVALPDSLRVLDATVTRRSRTGDILGPNQRVDVITALKAMTLWPAYQHFEEKMKGSLEVGKLADLVILSADPTAIDPETIDTIKVTATIKEGKTIYTRRAATVAVGAAGLATAMARLIDPTHGDADDCVSEAGLALAGAMIGGGR